MNSDKVKRKKEKGKSFAPARFLPTLGIRLFFILSGLIIKYFGIIFLPSSPPRYKSEYRTPNFECRMSNVEVAFASAFFTSILDFPRFFS